MPLFIYYSELNEFHSNCEALFAEVVEVITGVNFINFLTQMIPDIVSVNQYQDNPMLFYVVKFYEAIAGVKKLIKIVTAITYPTLAK